MARSQSGPLEQAAAEAVRRYLDALKVGAPTASRRQRPAVERRIAEIETALWTASPMLELKLVQERRDLERLLDWFEVERGFVAIARTFSRRHSITYMTWRQIGVPIAVLRRAGLRPGRDRTVTR